MSFDILEVTKGKEDGLGAWGKQIIARKVLEFQINIEGLLRWTRHDKPFPEHSKLVMVLAYDTLSLRLCLL